MVKFEKLLAEVSSGVERFVRYRLPSQTDADDSSLLDYYIILIVQ